MVEWDEPISKYAATEDINNLSPNAFDAGIRDV
jgi:hypothetical protein